MDKLQLEILLKAIDQATSPLRSISEGSREAARAVREARAALKDLERQDGLIEKFRETAKFLAITENQLKGAEAKVRELRQAMDAVENPTRKMTAALSAAEKEAGELRKRKEELIEKSGRLGEALNQNGMDTNALSDHQKRLKTDIAAATAKVAEQTTVLDGHKEKMRALNAAQAEYRKTLELRNSMAGGGAATLGVGLAMGAPLLLASREFSSFENAMLGVARQVQGAKDANGQYTRTYYEMGEAIKAMSERLPMAANDIAKLVEAGARMGIQGQKDLLPYAQLTATMSTALDLPVEQTGENIAKLSQLYKVPIKDIHQLGDAVNWLDEQTVSKSGEILEVMQRIAGVTTMVGMNYREAAALGSTFLSLGARPEVAATASNAIIRELSVAPMQGKRFNTGLGRIAGDLALTPEHRAQLAAMKDDKARGKAMAEWLSQAVQSDATNTIIKVMEGINNLPEKDRLKAATQIFGKEFGDDAAKLATNLDMYREQLLQVRDVQGQGSMDKEMQSQLLTQDAQFTMMRNTLTNLATDIGATLKPALVDLMKSVSGVLKGFRDWARDNPELVATLVKGAAIVAALTAAAGGAALAFAAVLGPFAAAKFAMNLLNIQGLGLIKALTGVGQVFPWLLGGAWKLATGLGGALGAVGAGIKAVGAAIMLHPLAATIAALGLAAVYVWKNWDAIGPRLAAAWNATKAQFKAWGEGIKAGWQNMKDSFALIGRAMMDGLIGGFKGQLTALKSAMSGAGTAALKWLKDVLGIRSPSKAMEEIGGYTMQGLEKGIAGGQGAALAAFARTARHLTAAGAGVMIGGAALAGGGIDTRPPLGLSATASGGPHVTMHIQLTIQAAPGMNEDALGDLVVRKIEELERRYAARGRSRFGDRE